MLNADNGIMVGETRRSSVRFAEQAAAIEERGVEFDLEDIPEEFITKNQVNSTDDDTDTDLDMNENEIEKILGRKKKDRSDCKLMYTAACKRFGVVPSTPFINQLNGKKVQMTNLNLEDQEIKAMCIPLLYNTTVTSMDFSGNLFGVHGCKHILEMLKENVFITDVYLANNDFGTRCARYICRKLRNHERIRRLDLSGNKFAEYDAREFADMLKCKQKKMTSTWTNTYSAVLRKCGKLYYTFPVLVFKSNVVLKYLNISHNQFGEKGGVLIGAALTDNVCLEDLDISWNHIRLNGATAISKSLKENDVLRRLSVAWNGFGNEGVKALGDALAENSTLRELDLSCNRISIDGFAHLLKGLKSNEGIQVLKLRSNPITSVGAEALLRVLKDSEQTKVVEVDIDNVPVTYNFGALLEQLKELKTELHVHHDRFVRETDYIARGKAAKDQSVADPLRLLKMYVRERNLNLVDYFVNCEEETEMSLKEDQFRKAIKLASIPISDVQLDELVKVLMKTDDEGVQQGIDLSGLVNRREYRSKRKKRPVVTSNQLSTERKPETVQRSRSTMSDDEYSVVTDLAEEVDIILAEDKKESNGDNDKHRSENYDISLKDENVTENGRQSVRDGSRGTSGKRRGMGDRTYSGHSCGDEGRKSRVKSSKHPGDSATTSDEGRKSGRVSSSKHQGDTTTTADDGHKSRVDSGKQPGNSPLNDGRKSRVNSGKPVGDTTTTSNDGSKSRVNSGKPVGDITTTSNDGSKSRVNSGKPVGDITTTSNDGSKSRVNSGKPPGDIVLDDERKIGSISGASEHPADVALDEGRESSPKSDTEKSKSKHGSPVDKGKAFPLTEPEPTMVSHAGDD